MGFFSRFTSIMKSNVNAALDKAEDPAKMVDQTLRDLREELAEVKKETASVMAVEKSAKRDLDTCDADIARMDTAARNAVKAGNDEDARKLLQQKANLNQKREGLQQAYNVAHDNAVKTRQMYDKLTADIQQLESRKEAVKAKVAVAKAQQHVANASKASNSSASLEAFNRMEEKADKMLDTSSSMLELNASQEDESADALAAKYASPQVEVDDELARMKAEMGC